MMFGLVYLIKGISAFYGLFNTKIKFICKCFIRGSSCGIMVKSAEQSCEYVHIQTNTLEKDMNHLIPPASYSSTRITDMPLKKYP